LYGYAPNLIASASLFITGARLGQMFGWRRLFLAGLATFGLASLACGLAPGPSALVAARVVQGAGGALMIPQILTAIQTTFTDERARARALSLYSIALATGAVAGQILGGAIVSTADWRPIILLNVPIAAAVLAAALRLLPADLPGDRSLRLDVPGVATLSAGLLLLVLPLTLGSEEHWAAVDVDLARREPPDAGGVRRRGAPGRHRRPRAAAEPPRAGPARDQVGPVAAGDRDQHLLRLLFSLALYLQQARSRPASRWSRGWRRSGSRGASSPACPAASPRSSPPRAA
jgi:hypothetical protein